MICSLNANICDCSKSCSLEWNNGDTCISLFLSDFVTKNVSLVNSLRLVPVRLNYLRCSKSGSLRTCSDKLW